MFVGIIKNLKVIYRTKILKAILTQIHHVSSAYDLSKKLTVLDAIMWTKAAVKEIKITTVTNCFKSCGFPIPKTDETSSTSESTTSEELTELVNFLSPNCKENYADIDAELETESSSIDILDFIPTEQNDDSDEEVVQAEDVCISASEAADSINKLKLFFLHPLAESRHFPA